VTALGLLDFARDLIERVGERYGRFVACTFALLVGIAIPIGAVTIGFWWYLG
jgi:hypothetical protein